MVESRKSTEADEVFEFLDSLPEDKKGAEGKSKAKGAGKKDEEDVFEFLEELEKSKMDLGAKKGKKVAETKKLDPQESNDAKPNRKRNKRRQREEASNAKVEANEETSKQGTNPDPIASISSWWSSAGSATVSSLWSKTTEHASQIKNRIQQEQLDITSKLNTQTITDLARNIQKIVVGETDEVLRIHLVHDLVKFPSLQYHIENRFDQVMSSQVEGGIRIFVDEWGRPNRSNSISTVVDPEKREHEEKDAIEPKIKLNLFSGKVSDGEKLAFANIDNSIKLFNKAHDEYIRQQKEAEGESEEGTSAEKSENRISDIFVSILPVAIPDKNDSTKEDMIVTDPHHAGNFSFTVLSQQAVEWLEGETKKNKESKKGDDNEDEEDDIVDPGEWVKDWIEDGLSLSLGILAQTYVIKRMGL
ncbi:related to Maintenance of telomere capping protein 1 [Nakaseomyces glabratus]|nr:related to Maintenance of telomere capping protein 1 [Nakaseomyces glabratus]SLM11307.1 related to Maintenance of telomere capping protein 1 [Nakaseomyces glabratus]